MKTLFTILLAMSMFLEGFAASNDLAALSSVTSEHQSAKIHLLEGAGKVKISVLNHKGLVLHCRSLKVKQNLVLPINLSSLPVGTYTIKIESRESKVEYDIVTSIKEEKGAEIFNASVKAMGPRYVKVAVNEDNAKGTTVKIYGNNNRLLFKEHVPSGPFARRYELKQFNSNEVYFSLTDKKGEEQFFHF